MPVIPNVTTKTAEQVWKSPDGQRILNKVTFEYEGKQFSAKTYSGAIANEGWTGDVLIEERDGKNGPEVFAKQAPKEDSPSQAYGSSGTTPTASKPAYQPKDENAIKAMWAIRQAKDMKIALGITPKMRLDDMLADIEAVAQGLFLMVDRVKVTEDVAADEPEEDTPKVSDVLAPVPPEIENVTIEELNEILGDDIEVTKDEGESPWNNKPGSSKSPAK